MALLQAQRPMWVSLSSISRLRPGYHPTTRPQSLAPLDIVVALEGRRYASVKAQGAYKTKPKKMHPKKYGAKRSGDQFVVTGNMIFKQKGTKWWPGENCIMGRDHTIHAAAAGYVKYYRDPKIHPGRQYIGVTFNREDTLPYPYHATRKRRLNMSCVPFEPPKQEPDIGEIGASGIPERVIQKLGIKGDKSRVLKLQPNYSYREDNYALGKLLDNLKSLRKKKMRSRRLHFRMARIKKERRHMRLRTQQRQLLKERRRTVKEGLQVDIRAKQRRRERAQKRAYKSAIEAGKTEEEAIQASIANGPRITKEDGLEMQARVMALWADPWGGKNKGANVKFVRTRTPSLESVAADAPRFKISLAERLARRREKKKRKNAGRKQKWIEKYGLEVDEKGNVIKDKTRTVVLS